MQDEFIIKNIKKFNEEIIEILILHFKDYLFIKKEFSKNNRSDKFERKFCYFYKLRGLNKLQKDKYFSLLFEKEKSLEKILLALYEVEGFKKLHLCFASKLIHTIDNNFPIYDKNIDSILCLCLPDQINGILLIRGIPIKKRVISGIDIYNELKNRLHKLLSNKQIVAMLKEMRERFNKYNNLNWQDDLISDIKLLDSILWALYKVLVKNLKS